jgi:hypothetical protein
MLGYAAAHLYISHPWKTHKNNFKFKLLSCKQLLEVTLLNKELNLY